MMLNFLDGIQGISDEFVFKGGNLLWHYIDTPRETIDLDLVTVTINSHLEVKRLIEASFKYFEEINFSIKEFKEIDSINEIGSRVIIGYQTILGQRNQFSIDIVYAIPTDISTVKSTLNGGSCRSASIENIISDKLAASHRFKSGNTRMKDFDDLWRISKSSIKIDSDKLKSILITRKVSASLDFQWVLYLEESWKRHSKSYRDIPSDLEVVFKAINSWLLNLLR